MTQPIFGLQYIQIDDQAQPVLGSNMDVIGIIGPCSTANAATFPLNTPVFFFSNDSGPTGMIAQLNTTQGPPDGYIVDAINGINDQLAAFQVAAQIIYVRTDYGANLQQTIANICGQSSNSTGVFAFLLAPNLCYCTPRLICAPGYTGIMANSLSEIVVGTPGIGYLPNTQYQISFAAGVGETNQTNLVLPSAHVISDPTGNINNAEIFVDTWGGWMTVAPTATLPAPTGTPASAAAAAGAFIFTTNPPIGSSLNFNGSNLTIVASNPTGLQVQQGSTVDLTVAALMSFLTASTDPNISACSYNLTSKTIAITNKTPGAAGNGFSISGICSGLTVSGPYLTGGVDAMVLTTATLVTSIALGANPVCATLPPVLNSLLAHAVVESSGISAINDAQWRSALDSDRLIGMEGGVKILSPYTGLITVMPLAPRQIGLMLAVDYATGGPFHSAANQPVQGIVGPARAIDFSLTDGATEGQVILSNNVGIIARGQVGVETAIASGGFISIATDNMGSDQLWQFYNVKRGRDFILLSLMPALRTFLGKNNIDRQTVVNIFATITGFLGQLQAKQQILGFDAQFIGAQNTVADIRAGRIAISFACEEPSVLREITTYNARYAPAIDALVAQLEQELNIAA